MTTPKSFFALLLSLPTLLSADEIRFTNGDTLSGRLLSLNDGQVQFESLYNATLTVARSNVVGLRTKEAFRVTLNSGETLVGPLDVSESEVLLIQSRTMGALSVAWNQVTEITPPIPQPADLIGDIEANSIIGAGKGKNGDRESTENAEVGLEMIGEEQAKEEDIHRIFLRQSAVLLDRGQVEFEAGLRYDRQEASIPGSFASDDRFFSVPFSARIGLVDRVEGFFTVPLSYVADENLTFDASGPGGAERHVERDNTFGFGDIETGIKYSLIQAGASRPEVVASVGVIAPTGSDPYDYPLATGTGFWGISAGLSCFQVYDPIVLFGGVHFTHRFEEDFHIGRVEPGEAIDFNFGIGFAAQENITLSFAVISGFETELSLDGEAIAGSSIEALLLNTAVLFRLAENRYLEPYVAIGLGEDASDSSVGVSYVYRF